MPLPSLLATLLRGRKTSEKRDSPAEGAGLGNDYDTRVDGLHSTEQHASNEAHSNGPVITDEEFSSLDHQDRAMLRSIIDLDYTTVREVMVPRLDMVAIAADTSLQEAAATIVKNGHSRLPVYEDTIDDVLGILYVRDLLKALVGPEGPAEIRSLTRPAFVVPETKRVDELLQEFRQRRIQIAIVVDEYGGTEGLVTMEDVLEEIVGEIEDEFSNGWVSEITWDEDGSAYVNAGLGAEHMEALFGVSIESDDFDTVGGFVYHFLGRVPHVGDVVDANGLRIEVASVAGRRLRSLKVEKLEDDESGPSAESG